mmetsp:Transcript_16467/g.53704  ORF Transcript_16467/g.53704 Transcript_16467/m.53704 type:complete len:254 (-) Transcript_16467:174-935(-)
MAVVIAVGVVSVRHLEESEEGVDWLGDGSALLNRSLAALALAALARLGLPLLGQHLHRRVLPVAPHWRQDLLDVTHPIAVERNLGGTALLGVEELVGPESEDQGEPLAHIFLFVWEPKIVVFARGLDAIAHLHAHRLVVLLPRRRPLVDADLLERLEYRPVLAVHHFLPVHLQIGTHERAFPEARDATGAFDAAGRLILAAAEQLGVARSHLLFGRLRRTRHDGLPALEQHLGLGLELLLQQPLLLEHVILER